MTPTVEKETESSKEIPVESGKPKKIGVPKEIHPNEFRVAATPETAQKLQKLGFEVLIESGAGEGANFSDQAFREAGCTIMPDAVSLWSEADIILKVRAPEMHPVLGKDETE